MNDRPMSVIAHFSELKKRMVRVAIIAMIFCSISLVFYSQIFGTFTSTAERLINEAGGTVIVQRITEGWVVAAKLSILTGLSASLPYFLWEISMFFRPGLKSYERKYIYLLMPAALVSFVGGAGFAWFVLIPRLVEFLLRMSQGIGEPLITVGPLVAQMVTFMFWLGLIFEIPITMFLLAKVGLVSSLWLKSKRRWMVLMAFILGAVITPTDPLSQVIVALPIVVLFEIGMLLVKFAERSRRQSESI